MRGSKRSLEALIERTPRAQSEPQPHWLDIDARLLLFARGVLEAFLEFVKAASQAYKEKVWEHFGYSDPESYFTERIGIKPRTFARFVRIQDMLERLPEDDRAAATEKVATIGSHKAAIIAAAVERDPACFDAMVKDAEQMTEEALQERVNRTLGLRARGGPTDGGEPGERFLRFILNAVPADQRDFVEKVFVGIQREAEVRNPMRAFLLLVQLGAQDLAAQGCPVE
jgi:hypothetical protein